MFDVLVATYFYGNIQKEFYRSLREHTKIDFRLLLVYTGNKDNEAKKLLEHADILWYPRENIRPLISVCNWAMRQSKKNDLIIMSDDIYLPRDWGKAFEWARDRCEMASASQIILEEKEFKIRKEIDDIDLNSLKLLNTGPPPGFAFNCHMISRDAYNVIGEYDERFVLWCGDTDYLIRAMKKGIYPKRIGGFNIYHYDKYSMKRIEGAYDQWKKDREYFSQKYPDKPKNL